MAGVDLSSESGTTIALLERSMLTSWPALSTSFDGDWVIRLAKGVTKRSNSVACLGNDPADLEKRIDRVEAIFQRHGLPPTFRISPLAPIELSDVLDRRSWRRFDESIVMTADLPLHDGQKTDDNIDVQVTGAPDGDWLDACCHIDGTRTTDAATLSTMLESLVPLAGYGRLMKDERIVALALAIFDHELVGLFEVMTAKDQRRQGFSRMLVSHLLRAGCEHGATTAWLAVVADNKPAVKLYQSLGFREIYRYHYRMPDQREGS